MLSACLYIATKVEEEPRDLKVILFVSDFLCRQEARNDFRIFSPAMPEFHTAYHNVLRLEILILNTVGFHVKFDHPYGLLVAYLNVLLFHENADFCQLALNFLNDR